MKYADNAKLLKVLGGEVYEPPPIWLMRQAGRYLPEYRAIREKTASFWRMAMTPELAADVTLQPVARFGFDAAILFSDIMVVPYALGSEISYDDGVGPSLAPVKELERLDRDEKVWRLKLAPIYEALRLVKSRLDPSRAVLGFAGAPWTLATYMVEGRGSQDQRAAKLWGYRDPSGFRAFLDVIGDCVAEHLIRQLEAGADAVQIFDSWASGLPEISFVDWVVRPTKRIVNKVREHRPEAVIIGFPRGATLEGYEVYARDTGVSALSLDTAVPLGWAREAFGGKLAIQGNLDPIALLAGGEALTDAVAHILEASRGIPHIFNLGHGVLPETPLAHVAKLVEQVRSSR